MSNEFKDPSEDAEKKLKNILNSVADRAREKLYKLFGPIEESGITKEQLDALQEELREIDDPVERAKRVYEFCKIISTDTDLPEEFKDFLNKK